MENSSIVIFLLGFAAGAGVCAVFFTMLSRKQEALRLDAEKTVSQMAEQLKLSFSGLSLEALSKTTAELMKHIENERKAGAAQLDGKKALIDAQLDKMTKELTEVEKLVKEFEKDRESKFSALSEQIRHTSRNAEELFRVTSSLKEALSSTGKRGRWGERMAEDILKSAGFMENVNYYRQKTLKTSGSRPDYTFIMPNGAILNMDVKFPLENYLKYLDETEDAAAKTRTSAFAKDVKERIKEVSGRDYIDPAENTLDFAMLFIPNEQIFGFMMEKCPDVLDFAFEKKVALTSPVSLFSVLAVIRQAAENFRLEQTSSEILTIMGTFRKQWDLFTGKMEGLGKKIEDAAKEYELLSGTRRRMLDKPLEKLDSLGLEKISSDSPEED
ncbi:DNA recombination protein RmuC [Geovibrio ferrireducens]|uniref:DNA recombination protein RmuC n=1 Tax=Geovibrio ferrireducens TaxID=46201 RepID=UPI0022470C89|nr:DNA recombination protein RmuC [Geovibrio ferrireducens]